MNVLISYILFSIWDFRKLKEKKKAQHLFWPLQPPPRMCFSCYKRFWSWALARAAQPAGPALSIVLQRLADPSTNLHGLQKGGFRQSLPATGPAMLHFHNIISHPLLQALARSRWPAWSRKREGQSGSEGGGCSHTRLCCPTRRAAPALCPSANAAQHR